MTINVPEQVGVVLAELAAKLGVAAEALWAMGQRQYTINCIGYAVFVLLGTVCFALCNRGRRRAVDSGEYELEMLYCLGFAVSGVVTLVCGGSLVALAANPAYYTLNYILGLVR